jgi:hypothetical protein
MRLEGEAFNRYVLGMANEFAGNVNPDTDEKMTDCAERRLIERELDEGLHRMPLGRGALLFEAAIVVTLLLATILLTAKIF